MTFNSAYLKLTAFYVAIVMLISVTFSFVVYQFSSAELNRALERQSNSFGNRRFFIEEMMPNFEQIKIEQLEQSSRNLTEKLILANILILIFSAGVSYLFAKRTMRPIEEMLEIQRQFTGDASHELRTPLTAMKTEIEVNLRDKGFDMKGAKNLLQSNLEEISKLESLSNNLLTLSRYESDGNLPLTTVPLQEIIEEAHRKIRGLAKEKEIEFSFEVPKITLWANKESLIQLFVILFDNAIKYSPSKTTVSIAVNNKNVKNIEITVIDQGVGIHQNDLPHIFNRFFRIDEARTKTKTSGFGLGLSIAKKIVEIHNGKIEAESQPDKGTKFKILLPRKENRDSK